jgi:hypothetical protein
LFFAWDITITADTAAATPKTQPLKLTKGIITYLGVKFPAGCNGMVKVRLMRAEFQLVPLSKGEWVIGDDETVVTEAYYDLTETPSELKFLGCSPGTSYNHTITVRVGILPRPIASMLPLMDLLTKMLQRMGVL